MRRIVFCLFVLYTFAGAASADEYIDPQSNVVYTYEPGSGTAMVKPGYEDVIYMGEDYELDIDYRSGSPDAEGDVAILDKFTVGTEEYVVTSIGEYAFSKNENIKSVSIPKTVTDIGAMAFYSCNNLIAVQLPEGLTRIASGLFLYCSKLVSITIPSSVYSIEQSAFARCSSLVSLTLPAGLLNVGAYAFNDTPWYNSIYEKAPDGPFYIGPLLLGYKGDKPTGELLIREGTTCIGYEAFINCNGLTSITVPPSVAYVDYQAFFNCTSLTAVHITDLAAWCAINFTEEALSNSSNPLIYAHHLYLDGKEVTDLVIPESVTSIGNYAFDNCTNLTNVNIPNGVTRIGKSAFRKCSNLTYVSIPPSIDTIGENAFLWCFDLNAVYISDLAAWCGISFVWASNPLYYGASLYLNDKEVTDLIIPEEVTSIGSGAFRNNNYLTSVTIGSKVKSIGSSAFGGCNNLMDVYCYAENVPEITDNPFNDTNIENITLHVPAASISAYQAVEPWKNFKEIVAVTDQEDDYRPFIEDDKVWAVRLADEEQTEEYFEYYYFDGDTIINGQTAKRMLYDRIGSNWDTIGEYIGAWYEQDKKVYYAGKGKQQFELLYDFTLSTGDIIQSEDLVLQVTKMSGSIPGFKGTYLDLQYINTAPIVERWLEGVGSQYYPWLNLCARWAGVGVGLLFCKAGDEIIYYNSEEEDPFSMGAKKHRFDFTHTIKTKPKARTREDDAEALYGEYNNQLLDIRLNPLDATYLVRITNESGQVVYEKNVNAGSIVGLNIDISAFAKGRYTVTIENSGESFTGEFETITTGIQELINKEDTKNFNSSTLQFFNSIYNLQGQRLNRLQKGLNIVNGRKVLVK